MLPAVPVPTLQPVVQEAPEDLFAEVQPWAQGLEGLPEYVEGFEGPQIEKGLPAHVLRERHKRRPGRPGTAGTKAAW